MTSVIGGGLPSAFLRYRILAFTTAVLLVVLVFIGIPLQVWGNNDSVAVFIGIAHGYLFMVYLITALDIGIRLKLPWLKLGLVLLAGTIPFAAFFAEHSVRQDYLNRRAQVEQNA